jgi:hypothetical protein
MSPLNVWVSVVLCRARQAAEQISVYVRAGYQGVRTLARHVRARGRCPEHDGGVDGGRALNRQLRGYICIGEGRRVAANRNDTNR